MPFWNTDVRNSPLTPPKLPSYTDRFKSSIDLKFSVGVVEDVIIDERSGGVREIRAALLDRGVSVTITPISKYDFVVPLISEYVLCVQRREGNWYYIDVVNNNLSTVANTKGTNTNVVDQDGNKLLGKNFTNNNLSQAVRYEGDRLIQGRFGNTIRLGSKQSGNDTEWSLDGEDGKPIIVIRNGETTYESLERDDSFIYLTSEQSLPIDTNSYPEYERVDQYIGAQVVIGADRLVFYSKDENIIISSRRDVGIKTNNWNVDFTTFVDLMLDTISALESISTQLATQAQATSTITVTTPPTGGPSSPPVNASQFINVNTTTTRITSQITQIKTSLEKMKQ